jgi:type IV secretion system protein VirB9
MKTLVLAGVLAMLLAAIPSHAAEEPKPGRLDSRMRLIPYDPNQVFHLSTAAGATLVVGFGRDETVTQVAVTDSKDLKAAPGKNFLFLKSQAPLSLQPVVVLTSNPEGRLRRYVFEVAILDPQSLANGEKDIYYSVQFTYPADEAAARRAQALADAQKALADAREEADAAAARASADELKLAHQQLEREARDPMSGARNWKYIAQGDRSILPLEVFDNGYSTVFRFPGNVRVPAVFVIDPDGKEATANYAVKGSLVEVDSTARQWRLRDGNTVLCVWNLAFDAVGKSPGTGTTSPNVVRELKEAPQ